MPVPAKRFKLLDIDYNTPITDFLSETEDTILSDPVTNTATTYNDRIQGIVENATIGQSGTNDRLIITQETIRKQTTPKRALPDVFQSLDDPDRITALFVSTITGNIDITRLLNTPTTRSLYESIIEAYRVLAKYGGDSDVGFTEVLDAVSDLDGYFRQHLDDPVSIGAAYLAILNQLHYAGYTTAYSKLHTNIPQEAAPYVAVGLIVTAANRGTPETIVDIGMTPVVDRVRYVAPDLIANIARSIGLDRLWDDETAQNLLYTLSRIDPNWYDHLKDEPDDTRKPISAMVSYLLEISPLSDTPKNVPELDAMLLG